MKLKNKVRNLKARKAQYEKMLIDADPLEKVFLGKSHHMPGSINK